MGKYYQINEIQASSLQTEDLWMKKNKFFLDLMCFAIYGDTDLVSCRTQFRQKTPSSREEREKEQENAIGESCNRLQQRKENL